MKTNRVLSIVLFILAVLLLAYSVWAFINSKDYIDEAIDAGQLIMKGNEYNVISFYMSNCALYVGFAVVFTAIGRLLVKPVVSVPHKNLHEQISSAAADKNEDENLDEWFQEMLQENSEDKSEGSFKKN